MAPIPEQPNLRTLALAAIRDGDHALADAGECGRAEDQAAVVDAVLAAVLPGHREQVFAEIARFFDGKADAHGHSRGTVCHYTDIAAEVRRLAATAPPASPEPATGAVPAGSVPEETPEVDG